jgi:Xaa-Pro aminopeptidase
MEKLKGKQAAEILRELDFDLWMIIDRESDILSDPMMDFMVGTGVTWLSFFLFFRSGDKIAIVGNLDVEKIRNLDLFDQVFAYKGSPRDILVEQLMNHQPARIAIDFSIDSANADGLTHGNYLNLLSLLEHTGFAERLVSAEPVVARIRGRKTVEEQRRIREAVDKTLQIFDRVTSHAHPGISEQQLASFISGEREKMGLDPSWDVKSCPSVFAGSQAVGAHSGPTGKILERGEVFNIDFGVRCEKYCADLQRTWYIRKENETEPPPVVRKAFQTIVESIRLAFEALRPGVLGIDIDAVARNLIVSRGYDEYPHALGHQVGRSAHDGGALLAPPWERYGKLPYIPLEKDLVFTLEPRINLKEYGVVTIEEMVVITGNGAEFLSRPQERLWIVR